MKVVESQGYSKQKAYEATKLDTDLDMLKNATQAWKKAGSPLNAKDLNEFLSTYIKNKKAVGAYLVVEAAVDDTRLRPYTVINEITAGRRKSKTVYQVKPAEFSVKYTKENKTVVNKETGEETIVEVQTPYFKETIEVEVKDKETGEVSKVQKEIDATKIKVSSVGSVSGKANRKDEAFKLMKTLIEENKKDYVIEIVKEITDGQKYAGYGKYTPSKSAKAGKFLFAVSE